MKQPKSKYPQVKPRNVNIGSGVMNGDPMPEEDSIPEPEIDVDNADEEHDHERENMDAIRETQKAKNQSI